VRSQIRALAALFEPDAVVELRGFSGKNTVSGYFDDHEALAGEAKNLDLKGF
jgi:hypothetical protein